MPLVASIVEDLAGVPAAAWDALTGDEHPFVEHAFLRLLESSESVGPGTGWQPRHVLVHDGDRLVGAAPAYRKTDSYGEYIFDWAWADAAARAGLRYYPKLVVGVPFTPATGPRLLSHPETDRDAVLGALLGGLDALETEEAASGLHCLFPLEAEAERLASAGWARRATHQYHWFNDGFRDFDDFLELFRAPARKQIRKERRRLADEALRLELRRGDAVEPEVWASLDALYRSTYDRKWGRPYLTPAFFEGAAEAIGHRALVGTARLGGRVIAATLSFEKGSSLYGRYWGTCLPLDGLHFELCYYQLIEHAIATGKTVFEAGAQGEHKLRRGFVPVVVHSAHRLAHPGLHDAIARFTRAERLGLEEALPELADSVPFRRGDPRASPRVAGRRASSAR